MNSIINKHEMPKHLDSEKASLACALSGNKYIVQIQTIINSDDFYEPANALIYESILKLYSQNRAVDPMTVAEQLRKDKLLDKVGGIAYINSLSTYIHFLSNAAEYAKIVHEKAQLRRLIYSISEVEKSCFEQKNTADEIIEYASKKLYDIKQGQDTDGPIQVHKLIQQHMDDLHDVAKQKNKNIKSGFFDLDQLTGGFNRGSLNILAARPAMGKSALALNIARNVSLRDKIVVVFSLEMSKEEIGLRLFSSEAMVESKYLNNIHDYEKNVTKLSSAIMKLNADCKLFVDDKAAVSPIDIMSKCRQLKMQYGLDLIVIDYLQLMSSGLKKSENRQQEIADISRSLKLIAKELNVPILALSQLSRACELRTDKKPLLSDLRESGSIEQDADSVMFLYRPDYYESKSTDVNSNETEGKYAELSVAKNRKGATGVVKLGWLPQFVRFFDLSADSLIENNTESKDDYVDIYTANEEFGNNSLSNNFDLQEITSYNDFSNLDKIDFEEFNFENYDNFIVEEN